MAYKFDYTPIPRPDYPNILAMADRIPPEDSYSKGWHLRKWGVDVDLFCCNFCAYDSGLLADVLEHLVVRHWIPYKNANPVPDKEKVPALPSVEEQIKAADSVLDSALNDLINKGALSLEDLGIG
jgi:hypothetical protein